MTFQVNDIVRLKSGTAPQSVTHIDLDKGVMSTVYTKFKNPHGHVPRYYDRKISDFVLFHDTPQTSESEELSMSTLYKIKKTEKYGEFLTKDSDGQMVLKMSDGSGFQGYDEADLEKVCPYTIQLHMISGSVSSGHYRVPKDHGLKVKDLITVESSLGVVFRLDTQKDNVKELKGLKKLVTEEITAE